MTQPRRERGAALLAAMLVVTLVASFAASALWQQWRAVEVETAERARVQSAWILIGALDWSRLILREDSLARGDGTDNLTEPWAVPLEEARLSTFLAADHGVAADASTDTDDAFLSGSITDLQGRLNLRNLAQGNAVDALTLRQFTRLFGYLGLDAALLDQLAQAMVQATRTDSPADTDAPLLPRSMDELSWWDVPPAVIARLAPYATLLPVRTKLNINTATAVALWASADGLSLAEAQQLTQARDAHYFAKLSDAGSRLSKPNALRADLHDVSSSYFEVRGQLRLGSIVVRERSLLFKQRGAARTLWRDRAGWIAAATKQPGDADAPPTMPRASPP
ncbi:MAG: general secretion pathway protein GspK [Comamonas sp. SCN 65-56]|uniref:type II secretion system minor pseudopilin GspK n=1 Tax=Comamonas sp. SCN 65-56 TaxID=1660095 RepID=UPI00086CD2D9|nr:type II secretion system minor pseudopilin GspK [Comamonas sp. SCN 65-56]ODS93296.1 MAG: general secretion pathway protein GspK [Comamonas sp. SCN 65-56]